MGSLNIHILQHVAFEGIGCITEWAKQNKHHLTYTKFYETEDLPDLNTIDWVIIMGGPMSIHDEQEYLWLKSEKRFVKQAIEQNKTIIGFCLGAQLIADVLGAKITKNKHKEIGWFPITKVENHILFSDFEQSFSVLHWHGETFSLPENAIPIFESEACKNQAFLFKNNVLGFQFHIEVTPESILEMATNCKSDIDESLPYVQSFNEVIKNQNYITTNNNLLFGLLDKLAK